MTEVDAARQRLSEDDSALLHENAAVLVERTIAPELKEQLGKPIGVLRIGDKNFLIHPANVHGRLLAPTTNEEIRDKTRYWPDEVQNAYKVHRDSEPIVASAELAAVDVVKKHAYHNGHSQITARITCTDAVTGQPRSIRISDEELYSLFFERPKGVADIADFDVIETTGHPLLSIVLKHDTDPTIIVFNSSFTTSTESAYSPKLVATQFLEHLHKGLLQEASQLQLDTIAAIERAEEREQIAYQGKELGTAQQQQYKFLLALYKVKALLLAGKASAPDDPWVNEFVPFLKDKDQSLFRKLMNLFFGHKTWQLSDK
ncbi:hypothetical protein KBC79_03245, partial [Candidatus Woesebacteria bacterium]|nr:hypothetical protein [Candidatus Woesebacteria bacterium]